MSWSTARLAVLHVDHLVTTHITHVHSVMFTMMWQVWGMMMGALPLIAMVFLGWSATQPCFFVLSFPWFLPRIWWSRFINFYYIPIKPRLFILIFFPIVMKLQSFSFPFLFFPIVIFVLFKLSEWKTMGCTQQTKRNYRVFLNAFSAGNTGGSPESQLPSRWGRLKGPAIPDPADPPGAKAS